MIQIVPIRIEHADSFWRALDTVAREGRYLLMTQAPPLERTQAFVQGNIDGDVAQVVALDGDEVIGWADESPQKTTGITHTGTLGMGHHHGAPR